MLFIDDLRDAGLLVRDVMSANVILSYDDFYCHLIDQFRSAESSIYICSWLIDFDYEVAIGLTFLDLISETCLRGVRV